MPRKRSEQRSKAERRPASTASEESSHSSETEGFLHEIFGGDDGVILRGSISVRAPIPTTINGLTIEGNVDAETNSDLILTDLWMKSGGNPMNGNMKIGHVGGDADVSDNRVAGNFEIASVTGNLKAVRNEIGQPAQQTVDALLTMVWSAPTADQLAALESRLSELESIVRVMEANSPGTGRMLLSWLKAKTVLLLSNESATGVLKFVQEQLEKLAGP